MQLGNYFYNENGTIKGLNGTVGFRRVQRGDKIFVVFDYSLDVDEEQSADAAELLVEKLNTDIELLSKYAQSLKE